MIYMRGESSFILTKWKYFAIDWEWGGEDMSIKELNEFMPDHGFCNTNNEEDLPKKYVCDLVESALREDRSKAIKEFAERL